jgi:hypothetical protein
MSNIEEIFAAWRIQFNPNEPNFDIASKRIEICDSCEFKTEIQLPNPDPQIVEYLTRCTVCGCALKSKAFNTVTYKDQGGSCPHGKWNFIEDEYLENRKNAIINIIEDESIQTEQKLSLLDSYLIEDYVMNFNTYDGINYHNLILPIPSKSNNFLENRKDTQLLINCKSTWSITIQNLNSNLLEPLTIHTDQKALFIYDGEKWIYKN